MQCVVLSELHLNVVSEISRLYVGSLHFNLTESDIKQVFEPFGELEFVDLHKDSVTGRSKGYAFVQYVVIDFSFLLVPCIRIHLGTRDQKTQEWRWNRWMALSWLVGR